MRVTPATEAIRDALALRHPEWDARRPAVQDLAAEALAEMHALLVGRVARLEQLRPAKYMREALRGERALAVEDLALLALDEPAALLAGLAVLARAAGGRIEPADEPPVTHRTARASFVRTAAEVETLILEAEEDDGVVDPVEAAEARRRLAEHQATGAALDAALARIQDRAKPGGQP